MADWLPLSAAGLPVTELEGGTGDAVAGTGEVVWLAVGVEVLPTDAVVDEVCDELAVTDAGNRVLPEAVVDARGLLGLGGCEEL